MARHVAIVGGGISGLATAWFLKKALGHEIAITLLEKSSRVGGWIQTIQQESFLFEQGPRSCRSRGTGRGTLELIEALNLQSEVIAAHPAVHSRFLYCGQQLQRLPRHPLAWPFSPLMKGWMRTLWRDWTAAKSSQADESIYSFFSRRMAHEWVERLIDPFVSGIYAGNLHKLSMRSCFPLLAAWEEQYGSLLKGALCSPKRPPSPHSFVRSFEKASVFSFRLGMETLPRALANQLEGDLHLDCAPQKISFEEEGVRIALAGGEEIKADHLISALPASALSALIAPSHASLSTLLSSIAHATVFVVNVGYRQSVLKQKGFGYLVPFQEESPILGCVWDSCVFPQQNAQPCETRLTMMIGGMRHPSMENASEQQAIHLALSALERQLGICEHPKAIAVKKAWHAIPQYEIGHHALLVDIQNLLTYVPNLTLMGSAFHGVSVNDCLFQAQQIAQRLAGRLQKKVI